MANKDFYKDWLDVPVQYRPPNPYQLLGLSDFESGRAKIKAAMETLTQASHKMAEKLYTSGGASGGGAEAAAAAAAADAQAASEKKDDNVVDAEFEEAN